jgi:cell wall surface anchor family protein
LTELYCHSNRLATLDITKNTLLTKLDCFSNNLTTLDVSKCTKLINFNCSSNQLSSLDVSNNTLLKKLDCYDNAFTTQALDDIYCQLPNRNDSTQMGVIKPIYDYESENAYIVDATNAANATAKNWRVQYYNKDNTDIPATKGQYDCNSTGVAEEATVDEHVSLL